MQSHPSNVARSKGRRRATALLASGALLATGGAVGLGSAGAQASSHREAPIIAGQPQYDNTDLYAFVSPDAPNTTTIIANWIPFEEPSGGPNFYPFATDARYDVRVDNNGDAKPDLIFRWTFTTSYQNTDTFLYNTGPVSSLTDADLNVRQRFTLERIKTSNNSSTVLAQGPVAPSNSGVASMPNYRALRDAAVQPLSSGPGRTFTGQADDPFFLDLRVFDLLYGGDLSEVGNDTLAGYNVNTVALQLPSSQLTRAGDPVVGIWTTTQRQTSSGDWAQVSRLGNPLVNEVVIPLKDKDRFNRSQPVNDPQFLDYVTKPGLPKVIQAVYGIPAPAEPRNDLVSVFLTGVQGLNKPANLSAPGEMLRLNTAVPPAASPNRLGVIGGDSAGYPNGRRLGDDVIDIALQVVEGELVGSPNDLGDAVNVNDLPFEKTFPYLALPHDGSVAPTTTSSNVTALEGGSTIASAGVTPSQRNPWSGVALALGLLAMVGGGVLSRRHRGATPVATT
jgi:hypothetical protein